MLFSQGAKDAFDGSAQGKSPCEVNSNEGRVDGRTRDHVESELVLKCEGNNNEGASDMLCKIPVDSMTQVLSHARKSRVRKCDVCVGSVFTSIGNLDGLVTPRPVYLAAKLAALGHSTVR